MGLEMTRTMGSGQLYLRATGIIRIQGDAMIPESSREVAQVDELLALYPAGGAEAEIWYENIIGIPVPTDITHKWWRTHLERLLFTGELVKEEPDVHEVIRDIPDTTHGGGALRRKGDILTLCWVDMELVEKGEMLADLTPGVYTQLLWRRRVIENLISGEYICRANK